MRGVPGDQRGIAPTLGVALLIVITAAMASVVVFAMSESTPELEQPSATAAVDFDFDREGATIVATHTGGEPLDVDRLSVRGPGEVTFPNGTIRSGDSFEISPQGAGGEFQLVHEHSRQPDTVLATVDNPLTDDLGGVPPQITLSHEDLEVDDSDFDYSDWVLDMETQITGYQADDTRYAREMRFEFTPQARSGGYSHDQYIVPDELGTGEYELTVFDGAGSVVREESGEFSSDTEIFVMNSDDAFDAHTNAEPDQTCTDPDRTAKLTLTLDGPTQIPDNPIDETKQHGAGLPFNPVMEPSGNDERIGVGDSRLVTVPTDWAWPLSGEHIATAYEDVGPENPDDRGDAPTFESATWYENPQNTDAIFDGCG
jgi:hypothetical protein